jgi:hypothetical protein
VFTQLAPWTETARDSLLRGEAPLWNRRSAAGAPLLANQQTAIFHPFTLLGLLLPIGKAFTLAAVLRLFTLQLFLYAFLRNWNIHPAAAAAGAIAYAFSTFNIVWLLFPLGLATWGVVPALLAADEWFRRPRLIAFNLLVVALALPILGGHPESAFWVGVVVAAYGLYALFRLRPRGERLRVLGGGVAAAVLAVALTAAWWAPTVEVLPHTSRFELMQKHGTASGGELPFEWTTALLAPNSLGTPQRGTYQPPGPRSPAVRLDDYGELASGYAGVLMLALAICALGVRHALAPFFIGTSVFTFLTITEAPLWYPLLRKLPLVSLTFDQRLRFLWALGVAVLAAIALDALLAGRLSRRVAAALIAVAGAGAFLLDSHAYVVIAVALAGTVVLLFVPLRWIAAVIAALTFLDLAYVTKGYNPAAEPADVYPVTGAIAALQRGTMPYRAVALGWSFIPETPGFYGIEDLKTTDPMSDPRYLRLFMGYLRVDPGDYDQKIGDLTFPFFDFLNVRYVYVPPGHPLPADATLKPVYSGSDGTVLENREALPRYYFVRDFIYEPSFGNAVARSKGIHDFAQTALVDRLPDHFERAEPGAPLAGGSGTAKIVDYGPNGARLEVSSDGWNLLVSSDTHWPGWRATFRGRELDVVTVNGAFTGVFVPPGAGTLELRYRPAGWVAGLWMSGVAAVLLVVLSFLCRKPHVSS